MKKEYLSAPLPFVGQKRMFAKEYIKVLGEVKDAKVFVDCSAAPGCCPYNQTATPGRLPWYITILTITDAGLRISAARMPCLTVCVTFWFPCRG